MEPSRKQSRLVWIPAITLGVLGGVFFWWLKVYAVPPDILASPEAVVQPAPLAVLEQSNSVIPDPVAMCYARALQRGDWDEVIKSTNWMQERLRRVEAERPGNGAMREAALSRLRMRAGTRTVENSQLRREGVDDQYVFVPGAILEPVRVDSGASDLEQPAKDRTWIRVMYPQRDQALRDARGNPIRSLTVGVNVSMDGLVLKGSIRGNVEVDWSSISYDWGQQQGA